jgi:hypothetical protein
MYLCLQIRKERIWYMCLVGECTGEADVFVCPSCRGRRDCVWTVTELYTPLLLRRREPGSPKGQHSPIHKALCPLINPAWIKYHCSLWNRDVVVVNRSISDDGSYCVRFLR